MMNQVVIKMLEDQGIEPENILPDDFGGYFCRLSLTTKM